MEVIQDFENRTRELTHLKSTLSALMWDQETMMPPLGAAFRAGQTATLAGIYHEKLTRPEIGEILEALQQVELEPWQKSSLRELQREYDKAVQLPQGLVQEIAETASLAYEEWVQARQTSNFQVFAPWLEKMVALKKEEASHLQGFDSLYDALLDEYEPGMKIPKLNDYFSRIRDHLTGLLDKILGSPNAHNVTSLRGNYPLELQREFGQRILTSMGFNWKAGRLDTSPHPFCTGLSPQDVRITTRYSEKDFESALFGVIHEGGHALYEQGLPAKFYGSPACDAISLGIHESQSRLWENQVGRSRPFWSHWLPRLKEVFPGSLKEVSEEEFLRAVNRVELTPIRVEADEVTYGLHVILRFELEGSLMNGDFAVEDLPEAWNEKMRDYLSITPKNDAEGVLQDTHWSQGLLGYFPTYLLGNLYAAQFFAKAKESIQGVDDQISEGNMIPLKAWLSENIYQAGKTLTASELVEKVTREPLNPSYFLDYLDSKFGELYCL